MKRFLAIFLVLVSLFTYAVCDDAIGFSVSRKDFDSGDLIIIGIDAPKKGVASVKVLGESGTEITTIASETDVTAGYNEIMWDGTDYGAKLPTGQYIIRLSLLDHTIDVCVQIHSDVTAQPIPTEAPTNIEQPDEPDKQSDAPKADLAEYDLLHPTPSSYGGNYTICGREGCYWCTPMDITDEEAVWKMLTSPMYVIDLKQKEQLVIREKPDDKSEGIGVVTGTSQGVHVLEDVGNGWTKIECYSSSFHDSKVKNWNALVAGYVPTSKIIKKTPDQEYGIVIDKLTQRLYLFHEGHLMTELLVSTGQYNERQPYNETRTGEFMLVSKVGDFKSDAMICGMAIRFDSGDLIHEVPHVLNADGTKNYKNTEYKLGGRGSHGCIRVQRLKNPDGVNMSWLYNHLTVSESKGTKLIIWEDYKGRQIEIPDDDMIVYYNANGGSYYHSTANCNSVKAQYLPLSELKYGELETGAYTKLSACPYCIPEKKKSELEEINEDHLQRSPGMVSEYHKTTKK